MKISEKYLFELNLMREIKKFGSFFKSLIKLVYLAEKLKSKLKHSTISCSFELGLIITS